MNMRNANKTKVSALNYLKYHRNKICRSNWSLSEDISRTRIQSCMCE